MSQAVQTTQNQAPSRQQREKPATLKAVLALPEYQQRFKEVLGDRAGQFVASLTSIGRTMQDVEPISIVMAAMTAAALDLPVDKNLGFAWIVPYRDGDRKYAQFQMGYKGYIQLGLRSNVYQRMNAAPINKEAMGGFDEVGEPIILWEKLDESQPTVGYAFAYKLVNGFVKTAYWPKEKVIEHAKRYSAAYRKGSETPWKTHFTEMAIKTVIKNTMSKWAILSIKMETAMRHDSGYQRDMDAEIEFPDNEGEGTGTKSPVFEGAIPAGAKPAQVADAKEAEKPAATPAGAAQASNAPAQPANASPAKPSESGKAQESKAAPAEKAPEADKPANVAALPKPEPTDEEAAAGLAPATDKPARAAFIPDPADNDAIQSIKFLAHQNDLSEDAVMVWARKNKLAKDTQKRLNELADGKLINLAKTWGADPAGFAAKIVEANK